MKWIFVRADIKNFLLNSKYRLKSCFGSKRAKRRNTYYCIFDPAIRHSGLADRLKTVIIQYNQAKWCGYQFKLIWETPFPLYKYFEPRFDWVASMDDLEYSICDTKVVSEVGWREFKPLKPNKQYHCYRYAGGWPPSYFKNSGFKWYDLFHELFKPSKMLEDAYSALNIKEKSYVSVHARFVNALEEFENATFDNRLKTEEERLALIDKCRKGIKEIISENPRKDVYVFSDSKRFLDSLSDLNVKVLDHDNVCHISENSNSNTHLKTFLDMWVISKSAIVYRLRANELLSWSGFAMVGASIGGVEFRNKDL